MFSSWHALNDLLLIFTGKERNTGTAIIIAVPTVIVMLLTVIIFIFLRMRKPRDNFESKFKLVEVLYAFTWSKQKKIFQSK